MVVRTTKFQLPCFLWVWRRRFATAHCLGVGNPETQNGVAYVELSLYWALQFTSEDKCCLLALLYPPRSKPQQTWIQPLGSPFTCPFHQSGSTHTRLGQGNLQLHVLPQLLACPHPSHWKLMMPEETHPLSDRFVAALLPAMRNTAKNQNTVIDKKELSMWNIMPCLYLNDFRQDMAQW